MRNTRCDNNTAGRDSGVLYVYPMATISAFDGVRASGNSALRGAIAAARASGDAAAAGAGVRAPVWFPRHGSAACQVCEQPFSARALRWRHHCRRCGEVFCAACSSYSAPLRSNTAAGSVRMQRVCRITSENNPRRGNPPAH